MADEIQDVNDPRDADEWELMSNLDMENINSEKFRLNPDLYIHNALIRAQNSLFKDDMNSGFIQFVGGVEHIEILSRAANKVPKEYDAELETFTKDLDEKNPNLARNIRDIRIANKKLELIMKGIFRQKTLYAPIKL